MAYPMLSYGSTGDEVKKLQQALIANNYLSAGEDDGIFGNKTKTAVQNYQRDNGLAVDGIAGEKTLGKLYAPAQDTQEVITQAADAQSAPAPTVVDYDQDLQEIYEQIMNPESFSYDLASDPLYQQYKDQYTHLGKLAMEDAMGQAAALTGGYGNSYAQTVGQQAYQGYMQQLNAMVPELYNAAYAKYQTDQQALLNRYSAVRDMQSAQKENKDELTNMIVNLGYEPTAEEMAAAGMTDREVQAWMNYYNSNTAATTTSAGGGGGGGYDNGNRRKGEIIAMQRALGVDPDGMWGPASQSAAKKKWGTTDADAAWIANNKELQAQYDANHNSVDTDNTLSSDAAYREAVALLKTNGKSTAGLMTSSEWARHKNKNNSADGEHEASSYREYLDAYIYEQMN